MHLRNSTLKQRSARKFEPYLDEWHCFEASTALFPTNRTVRRRSLSNIARAEDDHTGARDPGCGRLDMRDLEVKQDGMQRHQVQESPTPQTSVG